MRKVESQRLRVVFIVYILVIFIVFELFIRKWYREYNTTKRGKLVAELNGIKFYENDIKYQLLLESQQINNNYMDIDLNNASKEQITSAVINRYISNRIINLFNQQKMKLSNNDKFLIEEYRNELMVNKYMNDIVFFGVDDKKIEEKYGQLVDEFSNREVRNISHILFKSEEDALRSYNLIKAKRRSFEAEAKSKSLDEATAVKGGNLGFVLKEELEDKNLANLIFMLKVGEISKPIQTKDGWEIIKIIDSKEMEIKTLDNSKDSIETLLKETQYENFLKTLKIDNIEDKIIFYENFKDSNIENNNIQTDYEENNDDSNEIEIMKNNNSILNDEK